MKKEKRRKERKKRILKSEIFDITKTKARKK